MGCNYNAFSPGAVTYNGTPVPIDDVQKIKLISGDQLQGLEITLKTWSCKDTCGDSIPLDEWDEFDLRGLSALTFYFKEYETEVLLFQEECVIMDERAGLAMMFFPVDSLDGLEGFYTGQLQAVFDSGRIVTVGNEMLFEIERGFNDI